MPRVTLYVPDDLKARMDETGEAVNWSAVAQAAFKEAVTTNAIKRDPTDMEQVVERLRVSKARVDQQSLARGKERGRTWAAEAAEYDELKRMVDWTKIKDVPIPFTLDALKILIDPKQEMDRYRWHEFEEKHGATGMSDAFAEGFIKGAAELFVEIESRL